MYVTMLKRRLQEVNGKENPFSSNRYLAERMAEDFEKARISPLKKPKLAPATPEEVRRQPKRPRPYVDPWARDLNLPEYDPKRNIKVQRRSEEHTNVAMDFLSAKLESVGLGEKGHEDNTCKALALYQPSPLQRLMSANVEVEPPSDLVFSTLHQVAEIVRDRFPVPVSDLSKAIILYPVPENTIREALKKIVGRGEKDQSMEPEYESSPRIEEVGDEDILEEQEEEGDGMTTDFAPQFGYADDDLRIEELGMADEEEEEEEEEEGEGGYGRRMARNSYWVSSPPEEQDRGFFASPSPSIPCYWQGMTPPPTPLATSFSSSVPFLSQPAPSFASTDMNHFLSLVNGKLMSEQQQQTSASSASEVTAMPFGVHPVNRYTTGIESIEA